MPEALGDAVQERRGKLELFGGVLACGERGAHERPRLPLREHELGQYGLVELDELRSRLDQLRDLRAQDGYDVFTQVLLGVVVGAGRLSTNSDRVRMYGPGRATFTARPCAASGSADRRPRAAHFAARGRRTLRC